MAEEEEEDPKIVGSYTCVAYAAGNKIRTHTLTLLSPSEPDAQEDDLDGGGEAEEVLDVRLEDILLRPQQRHAQDGVAEAVEVRKVAAVLVPGIGIDF